MTDHLIPFDPNTSSEPSAITVEGLGVAYQKKPVLDAINLDLPEGHLIGLIGPNGAGKSTLLKACLDLVPKFSGEIKLFGKPYSEQRKRLAYVPQRESVDWDFPVSVLDVVTMGTYGKLGWFRPVNRKSRQRAREALDQVGLADFADRQINQLSGGQQQRTFLARAIAQDADVYLMDEPFAAVDAATEEAIVSLLKELQSDGKTCVVVHHDLATVGRYFSWLVMLNVSIISSGPTRSTFTRENLQRAYGGKLAFLDQSTLYASN